LFALDFHVISHAQQQVKVLGDLNRILSSLLFKYTSHFLFRQMLSTVSMEADQGAESITLNDVTVDMPTDSQPHGYDRLASLMAFLPEAAIFRRFATLNAKNLLYFQAELSFLEEQLEEAEKADAQSSSQNRRQYSREWFKLSHAEDHQDGDPRQWAIFLRIRRVLGEFSRSNSVETVWEQLTDRFCSKTRQFCNKWNS
jgi:hypothetical protein